MVSMVNGVHSEDSELCKVRTVRVVQYHTLLGVNASTKSS